MEYDSDETAKYRVTGIIDWSKDVKYRVKDVEYRSTGMEYDSDYEYEYGEEGDDVYSSYRHLMLNDI
jgi:hypothetical protein